MLTAAVRTPKSRKQRRRPASVDCYEPSPEAIKEMCAEIQSEWTEAERTRRRAIPQVAWTVPEATEAVGMNFTYESQR
ncbi:MAG: hypothetical protein R3C59_29280 [Planctomycetaceae bacterium]